MKQLLKVTNVSKTFGILKANSKVSFEVASGEVLAILGENGAGKTTLMNIIFGHYLADSGTCLLYTSPSPRDQRGSRMPSSA